MADKEPYVWARIPVVLKQRNSEWKEGEEPYRECNRYDNPLSPLCARCPYVWVCDHAYGGVVEMSISK